MSAPSDVLILGGGVIGLTAAHYLAREGLKVGVVDKGDFGREASWAGAGIIAPAGSSLPRDPYDQMRARSSAMFPRLSAELREATGVDNGYLVCGGLEWLGEEREAVLGCYQAEGIRFETCTGANLQKLEPTLASGLGNAVVLPGMAQVRNPRHLKALLAWCAPRVVLHPFRIVHSWDRRDGRVLAVQTDNGRLVAGQFLVATGAWTGSLVESIGCRLEVLPVRGQIALLNTRPSFLKRILLQGKRYLVPRADGRVLVGSTEEEVGFDKRTTASAIGGLLAFAQRLAPALADASVEQCWAGLRPGSADGLPYLGRVPGFDNLFVAAGHFRAGIQLSPITGLVMKELLMGQTPTVPLDAFRPDRPAAAPVQSAFRS
jgi:glycine oxidase